MSFEVTFIDVTAVLITRESVWPETAAVDFPFQGSIMELRCPNVYRRFELAANAPTAHVYVQDDDAEIDIARLWTQYDRRTLTNALPRSHAVNYQRTGVTLIGFGCFFPRAFAEAFVADADSWIARFGRETFLTECDRMFTFVNQPHHSVDLPVRESRRASGLSNRPEHYRERDRIVRALNAS